MITLLFIAIALAICAVFYKRPSKPENKEMAQGKKDLPQKGRSANASKPAVSQGGRRTGTARTSVPTSRRRTGAAMPSVPPKRKSQPEQSYEELSRKTDYSYLYDVGYQDGYMDGYNGEEIWCNYNVPDIQEAADEYERGYEAGYYNGRDDYELEYGDEDE